MRTILLAPPSLSLASGGVRGAGEGTAKAAGIDIKAYAADVISSKAQTRRFS